MQFTFVIDDRTANGTRCIAFFGHRFAFDNVFKPSFAVDFGQNRNRVWIPLAEQRVGFDFLIVFDVERRTGGNRMRFQFATFYVQNRDLAVSSENHGIAVCDW